MLKDELVRDRLVSGIQNDRIREKLLSKKDLTLTKAIQLLKSSEATQMQAQDMAAPSEMGTVQVIKLRQQKPSNERRLTQPGGKVYKSCWYYGRKHELKKEACPAVDKVCFTCNKKGHFAKQCRSTRAHHIEDDHSEDKEVFFIHAVTCHNSQPALVTCTVNEFHKVTFKIDTEASCNILPFADYVKATGDKQGVKISPSKARLTMHNNTSATPLGKVMLHVEYSGHTHLLHFFVMESAVMPILGKASSVGMKLVQILDCDSIHSISADTQGTQLLNNSVLYQFKDVLTGLGELLGEYAIKIQPNSVPVVNPTRRLPVSLRRIVKSELDAMVEKQIIAPVTEPTQWVSSMVVAQKKDGRVQAKVSSVLDAKTGFWQVKLTESSSYFTTFNTPFGRYRWKRMPFGISSAPEVWQQKMNELVEGLSGMEVIAYDFLISGFGANTAEATVAMTAIYRNFCNEQKNVVSN